MKGTDYVSLLRDSVKHNPYALSLVDKLFPRSVNLHFVINANDFRPDPRIAEKMARHAAATRSGYTNFLRSYGLAPAPGSRWKNTFTFDVAEVVTIDDDYVTFAYVDFNTGKLGNWLKRPVNAFLRDFEYQRREGMSPALGAGYGGPTLRDCIQKFHDGGVVGLAPGEVPAVLSPGEEVVPAPIKVGSVWRSPSGVLCLVRVVGEDSILFASTLGWARNVSYEKFRDKMIFVADPPL